MQPWEGQARPASMVLGGRGRASLGREGGVPAWDQPSMPDPLVQGERKPLSVPGSHSCCTRKARMEQKGA